MSRYSVYGSKQVWDLGRIGEVHQVAANPRAIRRCVIWVDKDTRCAEEVAYVWADSGRADICYCERHGTDAHPEVRNKPEVVR